MSVRVPFQLIWIALAGIATATATWVPASPQQSASLPEIQRGKYLVEEVAKCSECHTPRDKNNQLDRERWLQGAPIWIQPVAPTPNWAESAPRLAGLPGYTDEQIQRVLEKGEGVTGKPILPPMHIYHMNHADMRAIVAYLRSLPGPIPEHP